MVPRCCLEEDDSFFTCAPTVKLTETVHPLVPFPLHPLLTPLLQPPPASRSLRHPYLKAASKSAQVPPRHTAAPARKRRVVVTSKRSLHRHREKKVRFSGSGRSHNAPTDLPDENAKLSAEDVDEREDNSSFTNSDSKAASLDPGPEGTGQNQTCIVSGGPCSDGSSQSTNAELLKVLTRINTCDHSLRHGVLVNPAQSKNHEEGDSATSLASGFAIGFRGLRSSASRTGTLLLESEQFGEGKLHQGVDSVAQPLKSEQGFGLVRFAAAHLSSHHTYSVEQEREKISPKAKWTDDIEEMQSSRISQRLDESHPSHSTRLSPSPPVRSCRPQSSDTKRDRDALARSTRPTSAAAFRKPRSHLSGSRGNGSGSPVSTSPNHSPTSLRSLSPNSTAPGHQSRSSKHSFSQIGAAHSDSVASPLLNRASDYTGIPLPTSAIQDWETKGVIRASSIRNSRSQKESRHGRPVDHQLEWRAGSDSNSPTLDDHDISSSQFRERFPASSLHYIPEDKEQTVLAEDSIPFENRQATYLESVETARPGSVFSETDPAESESGACDTSDAENPTKTSPTAVRLARESGSATVAEKSSRPRFRRLSFTNNTEPLLSLSYKPLESQSSAYDTLKDLFRSESETLQEDYRKADLKRLEKLLRAGTKGEREKDLSRSYPSARLISSFKVVRARRTSSPSLYPHKTEMSSLRLSQVSLALNERSLSAGGFQTSGVPASTGNSSPNPASSRRHSSSFAEAPVLPKGKRATLTRRSSSRDLKVHLNSAKSLSKLSLKSEIKMLSSIGSLLQRKNSSMRLKGESPEQQDNIPAPVGTSEQSKDSETSTVATNTPAAVVVMDSTPINSATISRPAAAGEGTGHPATISYIPPPSFAPDIAAYLDATLRLFAQRPLSHSLYGAPGRNGLHSSSSSSVDSEGGEEAAPVEAPPPVSTSPEPDFIPSFSTPANFPKFEYDSPDGKREGAERSSAAGEGKNPSKQNSLFNSNSPSGNAGIATSPAASPRSDSAGFDHSAVGSSHASSSSPARHGKPKGDFSKHAARQRHSHVTLSQSQRAASSGSTASLNVPVSGNVTSNGHGTVTASPALTASLSAVEDTGSLRRLPSRTRRFARSTSAPSIRLIHPDPPPRPRPHGGSSRGKMGTVKLPRFTCLQFFRKRQTLDSLSLERPQNLSSVYESVKEALLGVEERLSMLELSFYGPGRAVDHEVKHWLPSLESVMAAARCTRLQSHEQLLEVAEKHFDVTDKFHVNEASLDMAEEAIDKILVAVNDGFADLISAVERVLSYMNKYVLSFSSAQGDPYLETAINYERQRAELRTAVILNLKNIRLMVEMFRTEGLTIQHFDYVIKEIAERCGCAHIPVLVVFPAACHNIRNACTGIRKWLEADRAYATYLQYDIAELEKKREVQSRRTRELAIKASNVEHKLKAVKRELSEIAADIKRLEHKETALRREEAEASNEQHSVKVELEIKELRKEELRKVKDRLPSREQNERYDRLVSEIGALRERKLSLDRKMDEYRRKTGWFAERRFKLDDTEKMLEVIKVEHKRAKMSSRQAEVELERLETCISKLKDVLLLKTSSETLKKIFHNMPYTNKLQTHKKGGLDKLERACRIAASWIEADWIKLYRALPFHPPRGEETISADIDEIVQTNLRHTLRQHARLALTRWRRMHTRANVEDLREALVEIKRKDILEKLQEAFTPRAKKTPNPRPYRTVHFPKVSVHAH